MNKDAGIVKFDEIGYWSEIKLDIIKKYAQAYSRILSSRGFYHIYIDAFAGAGKHKSKTTGNFVEGSPLNALMVTPPFNEYYFIDLDEAKIHYLEKIAGDRNDVFIFHGDCNEILLKEVLHKAKYSDFKRALCILDPYGLHLDWEIIFKTGKMKSVDIFLNFPVADMNRNVLWHDAQGVKTNQIERMNRFWGDESWRKIAYKKSRQLNLFGGQDQIKVPNEVIAEAFRKRLNKVAGFEHVPKPLAMRNSINAIVYYLFFASHKPVAANIVTDIFKKYKNWTGN